MNYRDVQDLIDEGEGFTIELKRKVSKPQKIAKTMIAFANTKGGTLLFGVDDDHTIVGVESEKEEMEKIQTAGSYFCDPPIEPIIDIVPFKKKDVIVVTIEESGRKPHTLFVDGDDEQKDGTNVYIRVEDKTLEASKEVVKILESEQPDAPPLRIALGENERRLFEYLDEHERITVKDYAREINVSPRRASRSLIQLVRAGVIRIHTNEKEDYYTRTF
jgi:predicted HTH transcriptional regulator